jgi:hypothetical protein
MYLLVWPQQYARHYEDDFRIASSISVAAAIDTANDGVVATATVGRPGRRPYNAFEFDDRMTVGGRTTDVAESIDRRSSAIWRLNGD